MSEPLRVGVVGAGYFAAFHHAAWAAMPAATLAAICDSDAVRRDAAAAVHPGVAMFADAAEMLAAGAIDLLDIATPPASHAALVELAGAHGMPAICQKPLAPTYEEAVAIVEAAEAAGILLVVHENFRFQPWYREARALIEAGRLGRLHALSFRMRPGDGQGAGAYLDRQPYFRDMPRFLVHETGIHFIDTFRFLMGEVTGVQARLRRLNEGIAGEDAGVILFDFENRTTGLFDGNRLNEHRAENKRLTMGEMWLEGEAGVLRLDGDGGLHWQPHGGEERPHDYTWSRDGFAGDCVGALQRHVVAHLRDGAPVENTARAYLRNLEIEEAVYRSAAEARRIALPPA